MVGGRICSEQEAIYRGFGGTEAARRRDVLRETIAAFDQIDPTDHYHHLAQDNLDQWLAQSPSAEDGVVYLDTLHPRVCIRGPEDRSRTDLGYSSLPEDQVFPFFKLRAAAQDLRDGSEFDPQGTRRRVAAQLETLRKHQIRHAVLGAFGCGAFRNSAHNLAQIYREEIMARRQDFSVIAFAVFYAGYGPDNYTPFATAFQGD